MPLSRAMRTTLSYIVIAMGIAIVLLAWYGWITVFASPG